MAQFWQTSLDEAMIGHGLQSSFIPFLTVLFLLINILKEIFQMVTERYDYLTFENLADLTVYVMVIICEFYYWRTGNIVNGYFFPD